MLSATHITFDPGINKSKRVSKIKMSKMSKWSNVLIVDGRRDDSHGEPGQVSGQPGRPACPSTQGEVHAESEVSGAQSVLYTGVQTKITNQVHRMIFGIQASE